MQSWMDNSDGNSNAKKHIFNITQYEFVAQKKQIGIVQGTGKDNIVPSTLLASSQTSRDYLKLCQTLNQESQSELSNPSLYFIFHVHHAWNLLPNCVCILVNVTGN